MWLIGKQRKSRGYRRSKRNRQLKVLLAVGVVGLIAAGAFLMLRGQGEDPRVDSFNRLRAAFKAKNYDKARLLGQAYVADHGEDSRALFMLGVSEVRTERDVEGLARVQRALQLEPGLFPAAIFLADRAFRAGRIQDSLRLSRQALGSARVSEEPQARYLLGRLLARPDALDVEGAIENLEMAAEGGITGEHLADALIALSGVHRIRELAEPGLRDSPESRRILQRAIQVLQARLELEPENEGLLLKLAGCEFAADGHSDALSRLRREFTDEGLRSRVLLLRWKCLWKLGDYVEAEKVLASFVELDPPPREWRQVVDFYRSVGRVDLAAAFGREARGRYPADRGLLISEVRLLMAGKDHQEAIARVEAFLELSPQDVDVQKIYAELLSARGGTAEAEAYLRAQLEGGDAQPGIRLRLADLLLETQDDEELDRRRVEEARGLLEPGGEGQGLSAGDEAYRSFLRAKVNYLMGWLDEARGTLQRLVRAKPSDVRARMLLASVHEATGSDDRLIEELGAIMELTRRGPELLVRRAGARLRAGRSPELIRRDCEEALSLGGEAVEPHLLIARSHLAESPPDFAVAEAGLRKAADIPDEGAAARLLLAGILQMRGAHDEAMEQARIAGRAASDPAIRLAATGLLAEIQSEPRTGRLTPEARRTYETYIAGESSGHEARLHYASVLLRNDEPASALPWVDEVLAVEPDHLPALMLKYEILEVQGLTEEATALIDRVAASAPESAAYTYLKGRAALSAGDTREAVSLLREAWERNPRRADTAYHLGRGLFALDQFAEARRYLERAVRLNPAWVEARLLLAETAFQQGRAHLGGSDAGAGDAAAREFRFALDANPGHLGSLAYLVQSFFGAGAGDRRELAETRRRVELLIRRVEEGLGPDPAPEAAKPLSRCYQLLCALRYAEGDLDGLLEAARQGYEIAPTDGAALLRLGLALFAAGRPGEATDRLLEAHALDPDSWPILDALTRMLLSANRVDEVVSRLKAWRSNHSDDAPSALLLGRALRMAGKDAAAEEALRTAVRLDPNRLGSIEHLTQLLVDANRPAEAEAALREVMEGSELDGEILFILGRLELGRTFPSKEGAKLLRAALAAGFRNTVYRSGCYVLLLRVLAASGSWREAAEVGQEFGRWQRNLTGSEPDSPVAKHSAEALTLTGTAFRMLGERDRAAASYRRARRIQPNRADTRNNLADLLIGSLQPKAAHEALELSQGVVKEHPDEPAYRDTLAAALWRVGRTDDALSEFETTLAAYEALVEKAPDEEVKARLRQGSARTWLRMSRALKDAGREDEAVEALRRSVKIRPELREDPEYREASALIGD